MITREFNLVIRVPQQDYIDTGIEVVQNDQNVYKFNIRITDGINDIDYAQVDSATITFSKGDGTVVQGDLVATGSGYTYELGTNEIAYPGQVIASIQLYGNLDERLTTSQFSFRVVRDLITPSAVKSESRFPILQQLVAEVNQLKQDIVELQVPDNSLTEAKMASDMKKNISGGVAGYDELLVIADNLETLESAFSSHLADRVTDTDGVHGFKIESGSWTPILIGANGGQAVNSGNTNGSYIKIGPLVYIQFYLETSSKGDIAPGAIRLGGLPFVVAGLVGQDMAVPIIAQFNGVTFPAGVNWVFGQATRYQTYIELRFGKSRAAGIPILDTDIATAIGLRGSMIYKVE